MASPKPWPIVASSHCASPMRTRLAATKTSPHLSRTKTRSVLLGCVRAGGPGQWSDCRTDWFGLALHARQFQRVGQSSSGTARRCHSSQLSSGTAPTRRASRHSLSRTSAARLRRAFPPRASTVTSERVGPQIEDGWYGHLRTEVTTRLYWRVATGHTVAATNSVEPSVRRQHPTDIAHFRADLRLASLHRIRSAAVPIHADDGRLSPRPKRAVAAARHRACFLAHFDHGRLATALRRLPVRSQRLPRSSQRRTVPRGRAQRSRSTSAQRPRRLRWPPPPRAAVRSVSPYTARWRSIGPTRPDLARTSD